VRHRAGEAALPPWKYNYYSIKLFLDRLREKSRTWQLSLEENTRPK
jgi:hypothetical protein